MPSSPASSSRTALTRAVDYLSLRHWSRSRMARLSLKFTFSCGHVYAVNDNSTSSNGDIRENTMVMKQDLTNAPEVLDESLRRGS